MPSSRLTRPQRVQLRRLSEGLTVDRTILSDTTARAGFRANQWRVTSNGMEAALAELDRIELIAATVSNRIVAEQARRTVDIIKARWPVDTGASRSRWSTTRVRQGRITRQVIANDTPYLRYIHRAGQQGRLLVETLVPDEIEDLRRRINAEITKLINKRTKARSPMRARAISIIS